MKRTNENDVPHPLTADEKERLRNLIWSSLFGLSSTQPPPTNNSNGSPFSVVDSRDNPASTNKGGSPIESNEDRSVAMIKNNDADHDAGTNQESTLQALLEQHVPTNQEELRMTQLYQSTYRLLQYHRDGFLVGQEYARWRQAERQSGRPAASLQGVPVDETALGPIHTKRLLSWFLPSATVRLAVVPLIVPIPTHQLYPLVTASTVQLIQGQQQALNALLKRTVLNFLNNPQNRGAIKNSTQGYLVSIYRLPEDPQEPPSQ